MNTSPDLTITTVKMLLALIAILFGIITIYYLTKRLSLNSFSSGGRGYIDVIENKYLGVKKSLCLVKIPGSILVLGLSNDNITYITEIHSENEFKELNKKELGKKDSFTDSFKQNLSKILPKKLSNTEST